MSQQLINLSPDLKRLRDEGYDIEIRNGYLLLKSVPYVNARREIVYGVIVSTLDLAGDVTTRPKTHVVDFAGDYPCDKDGVELHKIRCNSEQKNLGGQNVNHSFSSKPQDGYNDYFEKMATYAAILSNPAQALDPSVTAKTFPVIADNEGISVFNYVDTASSRAEITQVIRKLELSSIGIVGLGGTGAYVLDLIAKTPVRGIHLFDGDRFSQHNAFRAPGAPSLDELKSSPQKVDYFKAIYSRMHRHIVANSCFLDAGNLELLEGLDFVFICVDGGAAKRAIVDKLETLGTRFIDVGMGINLVDNALYGILRVTTCTPESYGLVQEKQRIPYTDGTFDNQYAKNIQIADLNALNAALAVVRWKKLLGFYGDLEHEHFCTYTVDGNELINEDRL
ncbi:MAG TPA: ThiF family adenylyltransferase [Methylomicrobium sp.]|nr:ThiF family adenylyltransferase [Methylomicrobium sp.]